MLMRSFLSPEALPLIFADVVSTIRRQTSCIETDHDERNSTVSTKARSA